MKLIRSHIYPKHILKEWINYQWKINQEKVLLFIVDLYLEEFSLLEEINKIEDIQKVLNKKRFFHLNIKDNLIASYEKEWNEEYEQPFFKIYNQFLKIHNQYFNNTKLKENKKCSSYRKEIYNKLQLFYQNNQIVRDFLLLNIFRAQFIRSNTKLIDQNNNIEYRNLSEVAINQTLQGDSDDIRNAFEQFKKENFRDSYIMFLIPNELPFIVNPPIYNCGDIFIAVPFSPLGFLCWLKEDYKIIYKENGSFEFQQKNKTEICTNDKNFSTKKLFDYNRTISFDEILERFAYTFLIIWLSVYGKTRGNIYFLGNEKSIIEFMNNLKENNAFKLRKDYEEDNNSYGLKNTMFVIKNGNKYKF